jgi:OmcA/MtrC family decaheme c-type cytochrome
MTKKIIGALSVCAAVLLAVVLIAGSRGPASAQDATEPVPPETCSICHPEAGAKHQAFYDELYQDGVIQVTDVAYSFTAPDTHVVAFQMTKNGAPFDANDAESFGIYFVPWTGEAFQFEPAIERLSLTGEITCDSDGACESTLTSSEPAYASDFGEVDGLIVIYGRDETVGRLPARIQQAKYPFAALLETGGGVDYVSAANNAGCEKCHTTPYLKHGYIYAQVDHDPATDFYTCKACHLDNGEGGHYEWQLLVDNPELAAAYAAGEAELTPEQEAQYAYVTSLMNDVHMSHAMEFPYPQSMSSCVTCHEGKLDVVLSDDNFTVETCKSCHPLTGAAAPAAEGEEPAWDTTGLALATIVPPEIHGSMDLATTDCTTCHGEGKAAAAFSQFHTGYDKMIYTADGQRYSDAISVTVDSADFDGDMLDIQFSAVESTDLEGIDVADIAPTVMVGLYGWDTKDYIIGPHERLFDDNGNGEVGDREDERALEYEVGAEHPRYTTVSAEGGSWEVVADLSAWTDMIDDGTVKRVEIAVIPTLENADGVVLALNAPSRTFDLGANDFVDDFYGPIVKVADGCENCHDALATNYHTPDRGGNIVVCRLCHITKSGGSHLEMQSRSIDSYAHAIHAGQPFDIGDIDFSDPVQALHYEHHIEFPYPTHGLTDCESCHTADSNNVPDQSASLPGLQSASDEVEGRKIGDVPESVTGPASRACGGCHRAELINEDAAGGLIILNQHVRQGGYLIDGGEDPDSLLLAVIDEIMAMFGR